MEDKGYAALKAQDEEREKRRQLNKKRRIEAKNGRNHQRAQERKEREPTAVYVQGLPRDVTKDELVSLFARCGILSELADGSPRVKVYEDESGIPKGDATVHFFHAASVGLACSLYNEYELRFGDRGSVITVQPADFSHKEGSGNGEGDKGATDGNTNGARGMDAKESKQRIKARLARKLDWQEDDEDDEDRGARRGTALLLDEVQDEAEQEDEDEVEDSKDDSGKVDTKRLLEEIGSELEVLDNLEEAGVHKRCKTGELASVQDKDKDKDKDSVKDEVEGVYAKFVSRTATDSRSAVYVVLKGMFTLDELEEDPELLLDLKEDVLDECSKLGEVLSIQLFDREPEGLMAVRFDDNLAARACVKLMDGRFFAQRRISAHLSEAKPAFQQSKATDHKSEDEDSRRNEAYERWLEGDEE